MGACQQDLLSHWNGKICVVGSRPMNQGFQTALSVHPSISLSLGSPDSVSQLSSSLCMLILPPENGLSPLSCGATSRAIPAQQRLWNSLPCCSSRGIMGGFRWGQEPTPRPVTVARTEGSLLGHCWPCWGLECSWVWGLWLWRPNLKGRSSLVRQTARHLCSTTHPSVSISGPCHLSVSTSSGYRSEVRAISPSTGTPGA